MTNTWNNDISNFIDICIGSLEKHAPLKKKYNNFLQHRSNQNEKKYLKQWNYCLLLRRIKNNYYCNLNEKNITDNEKFWKIVTPFLLDKLLSTERINLIENDKIINNDNDTANLMNTFFFNIVINLNVPEYHDYDSISRNISDPILKVIVKYRNHPCINAIRRVSNLNDLFSFDIVDREKNFKEIGSMDHTKPCQEPDISTKNY